MDEAGWDVVHVQLDKSSLPPVKEFTSQTRPSSNRTSNLAVAQTKDSSRCRSLVSLCVGTIGRHLEDIVEDIHIVAPTFPASVKASLLAVARRRNLLSDLLLVALADDSWEFLDVSGSDITDASIEELTKKCTGLRAVDISRCDLLSPSAVRLLVQHSPFLHTLRWGGTSLSNATARLALGYILPKLNLNEEAEESWEELDVERVGKRRTVLAMASLAFYRRKVQGTFGDRVSSRRGQPKTCFQRYDRPLGSVADKRTGCGVGKGSGS